MADPFDPEIEILELEAQAKAKSQAAQPPTPTSLLSMESQPGDMLKSPSDVGGELASDAAQAAGAYLLPEITAPLKAVPLIGQLVAKEVPAGIGAMKTFLSYLRNAGWAAGGSELGKAGAEGLDIVPDTTLWDKAKSAGVNTALGTFGGYGLDRLARGSNTAKFANELDPQVQRAAGLVGRMTDATDQPLDELVNISSKLSDDKMVNRAIAGQLGANSGRDSEMIGLGDPMRAAVPKLREMGIFDTPADTQELVALLKEKDAAINASRADALKKLDEAVLGFEKPSVAREPVWKGQDLTREVTGQGSTDLTDSAPWLSNMRPNSGRSPVSDRYVLADPSAPSVQAETVRKYTAPDALKLERPGTISTKAPAIQDAISGINDRIQGLRKSGLTDDISRGLLDTMESIKADLSRGEILPSDAVRLQQTYNEVRRNLLREFDTNNIAARAKGNTPNAGEVGASIEAISKMQGAIGEALDSAVAQISEKAGLDIAPNVFSELNAQQTAVRSAKDQAELFMRGTNEDLGVRPGSKLVQTPGSGGGSSAADALTDAATGGKVSALRTVLQMLKGSPPEASPALQSLGRVVDREANAMSNIRDLMSLNENPAPQLIPAPGAPLGGRAAQAAIGATDLGKAVSDLAPVVSQMFPQQAQAQPVLFPRDTQTLLQNPDAFMHAVAQASGGSPQLLQDVQTALREPNQAKREMALAQLTQMLPQLFEPTPYKSLWNGRITDPAEVPLYVDALKTQHRSGSIDANFLAKAMSAANADGSVTPTPPPPPPIQAGQPYSVIPPRRVGTGAPREYAY